MDRVAYNNRIGSPRSELSDEAIMAAVQNGDTAIFERLVRRYEGPLFNYIRRFVGSCADAEDIFQETFMRVYTKAHMFDTEARFKPWVYRIATNLCKDHARYRRRHPALSLDAPGKGDGESQTLLDKVPGHGGDPVEKARENESVELLKKAVAGLSVKHRAVFLMSRYEDMSYEAISDSLNIPLGTVKSRMNKAVKLLLAELKDAFNG